MSDAILTKTRLRAGVWEGVLQGQQDAEPPRIEVLHLELPLGAVEVIPSEEDDSQYLVRIPVPPELLSDGVQTFVIRDADTGARLNSFTVITGEPLEDDIRAELDLLRAELDMLKKAFRRHCLDSM